MDEVNFIFWIIAIWLALIAISFSLLQYLNRKRRSKKVIIRRSICFASLITIVAYIIGHYTIVRPTKLLEVYASPKEIIALPKSERDIYINITNNNNFTVYDVMTVISIESGDLTTDNIGFDVKKEEGIGGPTYFITVFTGFDPESKKPVLIFIIQKGLIAHTTRNFRLKIDCSHCNKESKLSLKVTKWSKTPKSGPHIYRR